MAHIWRDCLKNPKKTYTLMKKEYENLLEYANINLESDPQEAEKAINMAIQIQDSLIRMNCKKWKRTKWRKRNLQLVATHMLLVQKIKLSCGSTIDVEKPSTGSTDIDSDEESLIEVQVHSCDTSKTSMESLDVDEHDVKTGQLKHIINGLNTSHIHNAWMRNKTNFEGRTNEELLLKKDMSTQTDCPLECEEEVISRVTEKKMQTTENGCEPDDEKATLKKMEIFKQCIVPNSKLPNNWDDIKGLDSVKDRLYKMLTRMNHFKHVFKSNRKLPRGTLFYGPSGTGKTMLAKALARKVGMPFMQIQVSDINSKWKGDSEKNVKMMFQVAREHSPIIMFVGKICIILKSAHYFFCTIRVTARLYQCLLYNITVLKTYYF